MERLTYPALAVTGGTLTGPILLPDGTAAAPSIAFASDPALGIYRVGANTMALTKIVVFTFNTTKSTRIDGSNGVIRMGRDVKLIWTNSAEANATSVSLERDGADNVLAQKNGDADQIQRSYAANSGYWEKGSASELVTLSTSGTTTDTAANLLPANSIIEAVIARVVTTITTATDWKLGDATIAGRFTAANATLVAGTTTVGLVHVDLTGASGPRQTAAAKLRITTTGTPGAGAIRVTVFYRSFVPPSS